MRKYVNGDYAEIPAQEAAEIAGRVEREKAAEAHRQFTASEASAEVLRQIVNTVEIPDEKSVRMKAFYPEFSDIVGKTVKLGYKFVYSGDLYKTAQPEMVIQAHFLPGAGTESLYTRIDEQQSGSRYDAIPYAGNMDLESGKYYAQDGKTYLCTRDTSAPIYHNLADLVGLYVEVAA